MKNIIFIGPPGAGKGTQAKMLADKLGLAFFSTGNILRNEIKKETEIGKKVEKQITSGKLVSDRLVNQIVFDTLELNGPGFILDGYPRDIKQAKALIKFLYIKGWSATVIEIELDDNIALERNSGRRICSNCGQVYHVKYNPPKAEGQCDVCGKELRQRKDDRPNVVKGRLDTYHERTEPLLSYLKKQKRISLKYFCIDGSLSIEDIHQEILSNI